MPATPQPPALGLQQPRLMRECQILDFNLTTSTGPELLAKVSRPAGVLWISSAGPDRHPATAEQRQKRLGWSKEDNKRLFECYIRSEPERRGYRKRLLDLWKARNINNELTQVTRAEIG